MVGSQNDQIKLSCMDSDFFKFDDMVSNSRILNEIGRSYIY